MSKGFPKREDAIEDDPNMCRVCYNTGMEVIPGKGARECACRIPDRENRLRQRMPLKYQNIPADLNALVPRPDIHPKQEKAIRLIQERPDNNYVLLGENGTGKSYLLWAIFLSAGMKRRSVWGGRARTILDEFSREIDAKRTGSDFRASLNASMLEIRGSRWTLCIDEADKIFPNQFTAGLMFDLLDAAYGNEHQIIVATNCDNEQSLYDYWSDAGERYARSIMRRIFDSSSTIFFNSN